MNFYRRMDENFIFSTIRLNFEFYKLKANILLRQALNLFFKGVADGRMGFERHNEFAVRFKFRIFETCSTDYIPQISLLGTARYLLCNFALRKIAADVETG